MSTEFFNDQWRIPSNENQSLASNYSMKFNGIDDNISITEITIPRTSTISLWFNWADGIGLNILLGGNAQNYFGLRSTGGNLYFEIDGFPSSPKTTIQTNEPFNVNTWYHLAIVQTETPSVATCYINGVDKGNFNNGSRQLVSDKIGQWNTYLNYNFNGKIDQVCIFDYALPATGTNSVATLYGGGTAVTNPMSLSPKPVAYYQLGDQSVSTGPSADYLVTNNSLQDYVFDFIPTQGINLGTNPFSFTEDLSVSLWLKSTQTATNTFIGKDYNVSGGRNWVVMQYQNRVYFWTTTTGSVSNLYDIQSSVAINDGQWHHIVCVNDYENSTKQIYIDGNLDITNNEGAAISNSNTPVQIGKRVSGSPYDGEMSNVALWNTALTEEQATTLYNNGIPAADISSLSPIAWYKLNAQDTFDGTNWTIKDYAGSNDGTSSLMTSANLVQSDLQYTSGYSPYALDFDGTNDLINCGNDSSLQITGAMTVSYWFKGLSANASATGVGKLGNNGTRGFALTRTNGNAIYFFIAPTASSLVSAVATPTLSNTQWYHLVGVYTPSTSMVIYLDGVPIQTLTTGVPASQYNGSNNLQIGNRGDNYAWFNGEISNVAIWNTNLSAAEITSIYNQGVPSNLNTFSGTAPVSWWQIGSNSSFNPNPTGAEGRWTCLDEIGTNNGESSNSMTNDAITNGPGYSANGLGTSSIEIVGDAPYSTANGLSENMDVLDRTTDVPG